MRETQSPPQQPLTPTETLRAWFLHTAPARIDWWARKAREDRAVAAARRAA